MHEPWNKARLIGQKQPFTPQQIQAISRFLEFEKRYQELTLFCLGIDSMLRGSDLLSLRLRDVMTTKGHPKPELITLQRKTKQPVVVVLSPYTQSAVAIQRTTRNLQNDDYLFPPQRGKRTLPISTSYLRRLVKSWAERLELDPEAYSGHSLRRSKPAAMYAAGVKPETLRLLLGHASIVSTQEYLGINQAQALSAAREFDVFKDQ